MNQLIDLATTYWFSTLLVGVALVLGACLLLVSRQRPAWNRLLWFGSGFGLLGLGGLFLPTTWAFWLLSAAATVLFVKLLLVVVSGNWWTNVAYAAGAVLLLAGGSLMAGPITEGLQEAGKQLASFEVVEPGWLAMLALVPVIIWLSYRSLAGMGQFRRWLAIGLCCSVVVFLTLALAELRLKSPNETVTVLFVVDRSFSIPQEVDANADPNAPEGRKDQRWDRIKKFINESVEKRGPNHKRDKAGLIVFGRQPRLELPPSDVPRFNFTEVASNVDPNYTDIGAAIKLALASFPEGSGKRIVLISDGNENLGNAVEQARIAEHNKVQIDVIPLATGFKNEDEVLVQNVEAPPQTEQGARLPVRVLVRSYNPRPVVGLLSLRQIADGQSQLVEPSPILVRLRPGLNPFTFKPSRLANKQQSYTYEAVFQPKGVQATDKEPIEAGLAGDRPQNNRATTHVVALGKRRVLVIEQKAGDHELLIDNLKRLGESKFNVHSVTAAALPKDKSDLGVFLSNFDCVVLANVPAEELSEDQQEMLRSNTHDQGCGLIMVGGPDSFGAGGWQNTPVEKALPVDCDIKSLKIQGKGGLVLIMHACEMPDGNMWTKKIAKLAIEKLSVMDEVGVIYWGWGTTQWHFKLQPVGEKRGYLMRQVDRMSTGDMMEYDTALQMAYDALTDPAKDLATKHIILISDGDAAQQNKGLLGNMKARKVTCTTVGVATHGISEDSNLTNIATATGGRFYKVTNPAALPAIYVKESRIVSQAFLYEKRFLPRPTGQFGTGPTEGLPKELKPLYGFVRTTAKQSTLVEVPIEGPPMADLHFPILAQWRYGLGKAVAFTSDARTLNDRLAWDREWAKSEMYLKFWEQVVDWSLREVETGKLTMTTEYRDGKVKVMVDARDENNKPLTDLQLRGRVTAPSLRPGEEAKLELKFEQKNSGMYEAEFKADEAGSYFINAQARRTAEVIKDGKKVAQEQTDSIRSGVTIPYSPEFADMESNTALLEKVRSMTGGQSYQDDNATLQQVGRNGEVFRHGLPGSRSLQPVWFFLVMTSGGLLLLSIAIRRIAIDPLEAAVAVQRFWDRLRGGTGLAEQTPQFLERLKSRKAVVGETLTKAGRRFDAGESAPVAGPPPGAEALPSAPTGPTHRPAPRPQVAPDKETEPVDYASRLMKAKKRVWQDRDKEKES